MLPVWHPASSDFDRLREDIASLCRYICNPMSNA